MHIANIHLRDIVINKYEKVLTEIELSNFFDIDKRTVVSWIELYNRTGDYSSKQGVGCGRVASFTDKALIEKYLLEHPDASAPDIKEALAADIPRSTFYDCLNRLGFSFKKRRQSTNNEKNIKDWSILKNSKK